MRGIICRGILLALLCLSFCACGGNTAAGNAPQSQSAGVSVSGNTGNVPLSISILSDTEAEITFVGDGAGKPFSKVSALNVSFGKYSIGLNDFGGDSLQCSIWHSEDNKNYKLVDEGKARYEVGSDRITLYADMKEVAGFSFKNVAGTQQLHYEYAGEGGPDVSFDWTALADFNNYSAQRKDQPSSAEPVATSSAVQASSSAPDYSYHFWFMDKEYTTDGGITIKFSEPFLDGAPTKVTIKGAKTVKDGTYDFEVNSCIGSDDSKEAFVQGRFKASEVSNIKTEIRTDDGKVLMIDIYS